MNIRTFTARTLAEALATAKREIGSNAVVLHTKHAKRGGLLGLVTKPLVEVTAADGRDLGRKRRREAADSPRAQALRESARPRAHTERPHPAERQTAGDLIRRTYQAARVQFDEPGVGHSEPSSKSPPSLVPTVATPTPASTLERDAQMAKELRAVKSMVEQVVQQQQAAATLARTPAVDDLPDPLVEHYTQLIQQEIAVELAHELVREIDPERVDDVQAALRHKVAELLPVDEGAGKVESRSEGRPRTIALVGPTGVGKTTTVAKLAATFKLKHNQRVGLITADTYRIAAVEQLRTYAKIIGLPLEIVSTPAELSSALDKMSDLDVVLLDTAGRSQRNADRLDELAELIRVADPHETHLVLSSTASQRVLVETVQRFDQIETDRLIFTKLDEAVTFGVLLNVAQQVNKPLSYITTGQEVPHQIEPCCSTRLAELVLGGGVDR